VSAQALPRAVEPRRGPLEARWISDADALAALEPLWNRVVDAAGIDHPFLEHEWIRTWWECFGADKTLRVLLVTEGGAPVGIAPLMLCEERLYGIPVRCLQLIANAHTPRTDILVARGESAGAIYACLWRALADDSDSWDVLLLRQLPEGSPTLEALPVLAGRSGFTTGLWPADASPYVRLRGSWEAYLGGLARKHRANLRNRLKRLEAVGAVALEVVREPAEASAAVEDGFRLEASAWKGQAGTAIDCDGAVRDFYTRLALRAARRGWLRLQFLTVGGRRIAFGYSILINRTLYLLKPGYDPSYRAYSPSALLCYFVLRDAYAGGVEVHDFLGADDPWKHDWTDMVRRHEWLFVFGRSPRARVLFFMKFRLVPWIKHVRRLLRGEPCGS
jgi:CelD/BcsL family acetyltransferase involved in cellulose biosynthesis